MEIEAKEAKAFDLCMEEAQPSYTTKPSLRHRPNAPKASKLPNRNIFISMGLPRRSDPRSRRSDR